MGELTLDFLGYALTLIYQIHILENLGKVLIYSKVFKGVIMKNYLTQIAFTRAGRWALGAGRWPLLA